MLVLAQAEIVKSSCSMIKEERNLNRKGSYTVVWKYKDFQPYYYCL
jgi:hypothetical protein